jgi:hypothetical protein
MKFLQTVLIWGLKALKRTQKAPRLVQSKSTQGPPIGGSPGGAFCTLRLGALVCMLAYACAHVSDRTVSLIRPFQVMLFWRILKDPLGITLICIICTIILATLILILKLGVLTQF